MNRYKVSRSLFDVNNYETVENYKNRYESFATEITTLGSLFSGVSDEEN